MTRWINYFSSLKILPDKAVLWVTPIWSLCLGVAAAMLLLTAIWGVLRLTRPPVAVWLWETVWEGPLKPILGLAVAMSLFAVFGFALVREPLKILQSVTALRRTGDFTREYTLQPNEAERQIPIRAYLRELKSVKLLSDAALAIDTRDEDGEGLLIELTPGQELELSTDTELFKPFFGEYIADIGVRNGTGREAKLRVAVLTEPIAGVAVKAIPITTVALLLLVGLYVTLAAALPKTSAIALATAKSEMSQPLFLIALVVGVFLLLLFVIIPYNTFGEDIKMLKNAGVALIMSFGIVVALWGASNSIAEEIDGRTALTVLSKPVGRQQFIGGKLLGIAWTAGALFILLSVVFLFTVAFKPVYDARETAAAYPTWQQCQQAMVQIVPGLALAFMEVVVLASLSVAISTRLPFLANFVICFTIYALGHLTPLVVQSQVGGFAPVAFIGLFLATVLPVLENFNIQAAVAGGREVPYDYLGLSLLYCMLYTAVAILLAFTLFEDRDVA